MSEEKNDYAFYSEALHSSYLFYTMEVDRLNNQLQVAKEENGKLKEEVKNAGWVVINGIKHPVIGLGFRVEALTKQNKQMEYIANKALDDKSRLLDDKNTLTQQNKQMQEALEKVKKDACCSNGDCEHCEYDEDCFGYDAQQALKEVNNEK